MTAALHPAASDPARSRGRRHPQDDDPARNAFQRDRDRIVHSAAFRRLVYKTQVFLNHEGDLFRTRMTHSLEVAQVARSIARTLGLHEDLAEAISLAHDLGHTPFGHAGQDALNQAMRDHDPTGEGFEHNLQSLRVVDTLETPYPVFNGLNLSFETREGILKHCSLRNAQRLEAVDPGGVGHRFVALLRPSLEAQLCNLADEMAYNAHDVDDGVRSGLLDFSALLELPPYGRVHAAVQRDHPGLDHRRVRFEVSRRLLAAQIKDVVHTTSQALLDHAPADPQSVRSLPNLVRFGEPVQAEVAQLKQFLRDRLYRHPKVQATTALARQVVTELFQAYAADPGGIPIAAQQRHGVRGVADYIAGMTDRYALKEHHRLTGRRLFE